MDIILQLDCLFFVSWRATILKPETERELSVVEHELLIQTESGAVTDPVAVREKKKKKAAHRLPPQSRLSSLPLSIHPS